MDEFRVYFKHNGKRVGWFLDSKCDENTFIDVDGDICCSRCGMIADIKDAIQDVIRFEQLPPESILTTHKIPTVQSRIANALEYANHLKG